MKANTITFDPAFEKRWLKYLRGLTEKQKEHLRERLAIFKIIENESVYFIEIGGHDVCY